MKLLFTFFFACLIGNHGFADELVFLPRSEILDAAIELGRVESPAEVSVLKLSCEKCQEDLRDAIEGTSAGKRFFLVAENAAERRASQLLLAVWFQGDQEEVFWSEILELFLSDPDEYLRNLEKWEALCLKFSEELSDGALAEALNLLDAQRSLLGLLGVSRLPAELNISGERTSLRVSRAPQDFLSQLRDRSVSVSCLYPHFGSEDTIGVERVEMDPYYPIPAKAWAYLAERRKRGLAWHWVSESEISEEGRLVNWVAEILSKPTDAARRIEFESFLERVAGFGGGDISVEEALQRLGLGEGLVDDRFLIAARVQLERMRINARLTKH